MKVAVICHKCLGFFSPLYITSVINFASCACVMDNPRAGNSNSNYIHVHTAYSHPRTSTASSSSIAFMDHTHAMHTVHTPIVINKLARETSECHCCEC